MRPDYGIGLAALLLAVSSAPAFADDYADARAELVAAYQAQDYDAMQAAARAALEHRPGYPPARFNLALAYVLGGEPEAALETLEGLLTERIDFGVAVLEEFAPLRELEAWEAYAAATAELTEPVGTAAEAATWSEPDFIPEGIAIDAAGHVYLGSIRRGTIVRVGDGRRIEPDGRWWSVYGMRIRDGRLWFVSNAIGEFEPLAEGEAGASGLFAIDLASGKLTVIKVLPPGDGRRVLGDLEFVGDDTIIVSDQAGGVLYRYSIEDDELSELISAGTLVSPQGLVTDASGEYLYVADYVRGLYRVAIDGTDVERVQPAPGASPYGIDGLYRYGRRLVAIQNGITPHRVVEFELDDTGLSVTASRIRAMNLPAFDEPNLGVVDGDRFLFIANSHWNRFGADGSLPDDLGGPIVLELPLER